MPPVSTTITHANVLYWKYTLFMLNKKAGAFALLAELKRIQFHFHDKYIYGRFSMKSSQPLLYPHKQQ